MGIEIEKKFLVLNNSFKTISNTKLEIRQGYIGYGRCLTRVRTSNDKAYLTIKGGSVGNIGIKEWEYEIPMLDALDILNEADSYIYKTRWLIHQGEHIWEVDEFHDSNDGLIVAEIELNNEDDEFIKPHWIGEEVTDNDCYKNVNLIKMPFSKW